MSPQEMKEIELEIKYSDIPLRSQKVLLSALIEKYEREKDGGIEEDDGK